MKKYFQYIFYMFLLIACNDNFIDDQLEEGELIVVDGWIEQGKFPFVILTRSTPYFSIIDSTSYRNLIVSTAKVTIFTEDTFEILTFSPENNLFPPYAYRGYEIKGELSKTYWLEVKQYDTILRAQTTIPAPTIIDTAWFELQIPEDSLGIINLIFTDDTTENNYYRILTQIIDEDSKFYPVLSSTINDSYLSRPDNIFPLFQGKKTPIDNPEAAYFKIGDKVRIKLCTIDEPSYSFWHAYQVESLNSINPFASSSINLEGNIKGDGFGIWSGRGVDYYDLHIK